MAKKLKVVYEIPVACPECGAIGGRSILWSGSHPDVIIEHDGMQYLGYSERRCNCGGCDTNFYVYHIHGELK